MPLLSYKTCFVMFYLDIVAVTCSAVTGVFEKLINVPLPLSASLHSPATEICQTVLSFFFKKLFCVLNEVEYRTLQSVTLWHWSLTPLTNYVFKVLPFRLFRLTSSSTCVPPWQDDEVVLQCVAAIQKENRKFCLSAEGLGNRLCYLEPTSEAKV